MTSEFGIFGLERTTSKEEIQEKSGQPYLFRKYPDQFHSLKEAKEELDKIIEGDSLYPHYVFNKYIILEIYSKKH